MFNDTLDAFGNAPVSQKFRTPPAAGTSLIECCIGTLLISSVDLRSGVGLVRIG